MIESLIANVKSKVASLSRPIPFPPASAHNLEETEKRLGFSIPPLLKALYLQVGNGGFGPGRGGAIIGAKGGYASDLGLLDECFWQVDNGMSQEGRRWNDALLPFCEWGCNIFSCVDCKDPSFAIWLLDEGDISHTGYTLQDFFEMWSQGKDILSQEAMPRDFADIINPFTGRKDRISKRRKELP